MSLYPQPSQVSVSKLIFCLDLVKILNPVVDLSLQEDLVLLQVSLLASIVEDVAEDP